MADFIQIAKDSSRARRELIKMIPADCKVNPKYSGELSNEAFVAAFGKLQQLIIDIYSDVERDPLIWGYPTEGGSEDLFASAFNRVTDIFSAVAGGSYQDGRITGIVIKLKKSDMAIKRLDSFGLALVKEADKTYTATYADADVLYVLSAFMRAQDAEMTHSWSMRYAFASFSYRWIENPSEQKYETIFLVYTDSLSEKMRQIQFWLHDTAAEYGYTLNRKKPFDKSAPFYVKGSKDFIAVYLTKEGDIQTKIIFRSVFEAAPDKVAALDRKLPGVFGASYANCSRCQGRKARDEECSMRICYTLNGNYYENCAYHSFRFTIPSLDVLKDIFELAVVEKKLKK